MNRNTSAAASSRDLPAADQRQSHAPRLGDAARIARCLALSFFQGTPAGAIAEKRYADRENVLAYFARSGEVAGHNTGGAGGELKAEGLGELGAAIALHEALGQLQGVQDVPFNLVLSNTDVEGTATLAGEGKAIRVTAQDFSNRFVLARQKVAAISVVSKELLKDGANADRIIGRNLLRAAVRGSDALAFSTSASQSLLNGVSPIVSGGSTAEDIDYDLRELLASLTDADLFTVNFVCHPAVSLGLSLLRLTTGERAYPNVTVKGGEIAGVPLVVSSGVPSSVLVAIDGAQVLRAQEAPRLDLATQTTLELSSEPTGDETVPTGATQATVSLFQSDAAAIRIVRPVNWRIRRAGAIGYLSSFNPGAGITTD
jgi:hypothetical protein